MDLNLSNTRISDAGLIAFKRLMFLQELNLANTQITDAGLEHLKEQTYLRRLYLGGTKVTSAGIDSLLKIRQARKDAWKDEFVKRQSEHARVLGVVVPPDLLIIMDRTRTNSPPAYPTHY